MRGPLQEGVRTTGEAAVHAPVMLARAQHAQVLAFFVLAFAAGGVIQPFLNLYLVEVGFSGAQVGMLNGYSSLAIVALTPLIGRLADRTQRHRLILGIIVAVKGLATPALLLSSAWGWLAALVTIRVMTAGAQDALMNRLTMAHLLRRGGGDFGGIRFWGALSFAATSLLAGWLGRAGSVSVLFPMAGVLGLLAALCAGGFPASLAPKSVPTRGISARRLERSPTLTALFGLIFVLSIGKSAFETFAGIYIKTELGADNAWIGLLGAATSISPLPALAIAGPLLRRCSRSGLLAAGIASSASAYGLLALAPTIVYTLPVMLLHGAAGALTLTGVVILLSQVGLPEQAATDQMLAQLTVPGLAGLAAQPLGGLLLDVYGGRLLFAISAVVTLAGTVMIGRLQRQLNP